MMTTGKVLGLLSLIMTITMLVGAWRVGNYDFLILSACLVVGGLLGALFSGNDLWARFLWLMVGAAVGWMIILDEPLSLLLIVPILGWITWRRRTPGYR